MLKASNIFKSYVNGTVKTPVLNDISLCVEAGSFTAVTGNSGSGKSTLLYILSGLLLPDSGEVCLNDTDITKLSDNQLSDLRCRDIGFVFQFYNIIPTMTVEENVKLPIILAKEDPSKKQDRIEELLKEVGLYEKRNKAAMNLSGGEQQRAAIARALINQPSVIFADEPTGNLDSANAEIVLKLLRELCTKFKTTILMVTHNTESARICDNIINIKDGRI